LVEFFACVPSTVRWLLAIIPCIIFMQQVLNLLNISADLVCPALNNVLLVSTGLGTAGLGLGRGHVGLDLGLGLGRPGLDNMNALKLLTLRRRQCLRRSPRAHATAILDGRCR
jgi:hypothetical protein